MLFHIYFSLFSWDLFDMAGPFIMHKVLQISFIAKFLENLLQGLRIPGDFFQICNAVFTEKQPVQGAHSRNAAGTGRREGTVIGKNTGKLPFPEYIFQK